MKKKIAKKISIKKLDSRKTNPLLKNYPRKELLLKKLSKKKKIKFKKKKNFQNFFFPKQTFYKI